MVRAWIAGLGLLATTLTAAGAAAQDDERTVWKVSLWGERREFTEHVEHLARTVRLRTRGAFTIELHYGGLARNVENLDGIAAGLFEMAQFCVGYHPEKTPSLTALELPFLGVRALEEELAVSRAVYALPQVAAEMAQWNAVLLMATPLPQYNLVGSGAAPEGLDWLAGRTIRATGGIGEVLARFGADPVSLTATETLDAMAGGTLDAVAFAQHAHFSFDTISLARWWTANLDPGTVNCPVVVNADAYAALPPEHRRVLDAATEPALAQYLANYADLIGKWAEVLEVFGVEQVTFPQEELDRMEREAEAIRADWLAQRSAEGLPADALLATIGGALRTARTGGS